MSVCEFACKCQSFRASLWSVVGQFSLARSLVLLGSFCCCLLVIFFSLAKKRELIHFSAAGRPAGQLAGCRSANSSGLACAPPMVSGASHAIRAFSAAGHLSRARTREPIFKQKRPLGRPRESFRVAEKKVSCCTGQAHSGARIIDSRRHRLQGGRGAGVTRAPVGAAGIRPRGRGEKCHFSPPLTLAVLEAVAGQVGRDKALRVADELRVLIETLAGRAQLKSLVFGCTVWLFANG